MNESYADEVEKTLLYIAEARSRAERARQALKDSGAPSHLLVALKAAEEALEEDHRRLMQGTLFAVPNEQERLIA